MLTGQRLFPGGETVSHVLADVLRAPIDLSRLPAATPPSIRELLRRCLDRDVKNRLRDIGEARVALSKPAELTAPARELSPRRSAVLAWGVAGVLAIAAAALAVIHFREAPPEARLTRTYIPP